MDDKPWIEHYNWFHLLLLNLAIFVHLLWLRFVQVHVRVDWFWIHLFVVQIG